MLPFPNALFGKNGKSAQRSAMVAGGQTPGSQGALTGDMFVVWRNGNYTTTPSLYKDSVPTKNHPLTQLRAYSNSDGASLWYTILTEESKDATLYNRDENNNFLTTGVRGVSYTGPKNLALVKNVSMVLPATTPGIVKSVDHMGFLQYNNNTDVFNGASITAISPEMALIYATVASRNANFRDIIPPGLSYIDNTPFNVQGTGNILFQIIELRG